MESSSLIYHHNVQQTQTKVGGQLLLADTTVELWPQLGSVVEGLQLLVYIARLWPDCAHPLTDLRSTSQNPSTHVSTRYSNSHRSNELRVSFLAENSRFTRWKNAQSMASLRVDMGTASTSCSLIKCTVHWFMRIRGSARYIRVSCHFQHRGSAILGWRGHWCLCSILCQPLCAAGLYSVRSIAIVAGH